MNMRNLVAAVAALCLLGVTSGCSLLGFGGSPRDPDGEVTASQNVDAFSLRVGDCIISSELDENFSEVPVVPCTQPHDAEIYYLFDMPGDTFDEEAATEAAREVCPEMIEEYVGPNWAYIASEGLGAAWFLPTDDTWKRGDREVDCVAYTVSGENELTSSVKDMGR